MHSLYSLNVEIIKSKPVVKSIGIILRDHLVNRHNSWLSWWPALFVGLDVERVEVENVWRVVLLLLFKESNFILSPEMDSIIEPLRFELTLELESLHWEQQNCVNGSLVEAAFWDPNKLKRLYNDIWININFIEIIIIFMIGIILTHTKKKSVEKIQLIIESTIKKVPICT